MFRLGICVGIVIMCLVPTSVHNQIRSTSISVCIKLFNKLHEVALEEEKFEIKKVAKRSSSVYID